MKRRSSIRFVRFKSLSLTPCRRVGPYNFTETGTIDVRDTLKIENQLLVALLNQATNLVFEELVARPDGRLT